MFTKIIADFEPGDTTRYVVGVTTVSREAQRIMGYSTDANVILFTFGGGSNPHHGFIDVSEGRYKNVGEVMRDLHMESHEKYTACAALFILAEIFGVEPRGDEYVEISKRFIDWVPTWKDRFAEIIEELT